MKILIVYYSRTGRTRKIAEALGSMLNADIEEIHDVKSRKGIIGYLLAGKDATLKKLTDIKAGLKNPADYDLVIIGTPVWAFTMAPAIRSWLKKYGSQLKEVVFFATMSGRGDKRTFQHMAEFCQKQPLTTSTFIDKKIDKDLHIEALKAFAESVKTFELEATQSK